MAENLYFIAPRLTAVTLGRSEGPIEPELTKIFKEAKKFVKLKLVWTRIIGELLTFLNADLESLIIDHCHYMKSLYLCEAIGRFQSLKHLEISAYIELDNSILQALVYNTYISKTMDQA